MDKPHKMGDKRPAGRPNTEAGPAGASSSTSSIEGAVFEFNQFIKDKSLLGRDTEKFSQVSLRSKASKGSNKSKTSRKSMSTFHVIDPVQHSASIVEPQTSKSKVNEDLSGLSLTRLDKRKPGADKQFSKAAPFWMKWIHGYNPRAGVVNLTRGKQTVIFYAAVNCGVLYNWRTQQMHILQGHKNMVTCIEADSKGEWLVTADSGSDNVIIIWNCTTRVPTRTLFNPHGSLKVSKVAITSDAKYLLSLGYDDKAILFWWIWSFGLDMPHACLKVDVPKHAIKDMKFNPTDSTQFALLTKYDLYIGQSAKIFKMERGVMVETADYELKARKVPRNSAVDCGNLTCLTFVHNSSQILVGSARGVVLVYGYSLEYEVANKTRGIDELKYIKPIKVEDGQINVMRSLNGLVLIGDNVGQIRYFDERLRLVYWVQGFQPDSIVDLSFDLTQKSYQVVDVKCDRWCICWENIPEEIDEATGLAKQKLARKKTPTTATLDSDVFFVRDYIICTRQQGICAVDSARERTTVIVDCNSSYITAMAVHPERPLVCLGRANGTVELYSFSRPRVLARLDLRDHFKVVLPPSQDSVHSATEVLVPALTVSCLKYAPSGFHLACGLNDGSLLFLEPSSLALAAPAPRRDAEHAATMMDFCGDSLTLAMADEGNTVCVYRFDCDSSKWCFVGKHRSHYKTITAVLFTNDKNADGFPKLLSLGKDRMMVEYDIGASEDEQLKIYSLDRVDQSAVPLHAIVWPNDKDLNPEECRTDLPLILVATDEYKYKLVNYSTAMTLSTVLGPRHGTPVRRAQLLTAPGDIKTYLAFSTRNIIGLQKMPLDGNPWKHTSILGHPIEVKDMYMRQDIDICFTIGAKDPCLIMWRAKYDSVEKTSHLGGDALDPYYCLIEGGRPGWLFTEIRDLFYYIQILCQGTVSPVMRKVKDFIPIDSLPDLMRALGFFPSEFEVENLLTEARHAVYRRAPVRELDFEQFVKLYLNHRPARGESLARLTAAFSHFARAAAAEPAAEPAVERAEPAVDRRDFLDALGTCGERFTPELQRYLLSTLCRLSADERAAAAAAAADDDDTGFGFLPEKITLSYFLRIIIGVADAEAAGAAGGSPRGSLSSSPTAASVDSGSDL